MLCSKNLFHLNNKAIKYFWVISTKNKCYLPEKKNCILNGKAIFIYPSKRISKEMHFILAFLEEITIVSLSLKVRGGRDVKFQSVDWPFFSLLRKWLFSWSLLRHHYIENGFLVNHYYKNQNVEKNIKIKTFDVLILPMASKKITTSKIKNSNYLWHITYGCQGLWGVRLGSIRLG
jgi:hypothetical protein